MWFHRCRYERTERVKPILLNICTVCVPERRLLPRGTLYQSIDFTWLLIKARIWAKRPHGYCQNSEGVKGMKIISGGPKKGLGSCSGSDFRFKIVRLSLANHELWLLSLRLTTDISPCRTRNITRNNNAFGGIPNRVLARFRVPTIPKADLPWNILPILSNEEEEEENGLSVSLIKVGQWALRKKNTAEPFFIKNKRPTL